jgi:hypothetical protein
MYEPMQILLDAPVAQDERNVRVAAIPTPEAGNLSAAVRPGSTWHSVDP